MKMTVVYLGPWIHGGLTSSVWIHGWDLDWSHDDVDVTMSLAIGSFLSWAMPLMYVEFDRVMSWCSDHHHRAPCPDDWTTQDMGVYVNFLFFSIELDGSHGWWIGRGFFVIRRLSNLWLISLGTGVRRSVISLVYLPKALWSWSSIITQIGVVLVTTGRDFPSWFTGASRRTTAHSLSLDVHVFWQFRQ